MCNRSHYYITIRTLLLTACFPMNRQTPTAADAALFIIYPKRMYVP